MKGMACELLGWSKINYRSLEDKIKKLKVEV